MSQSDSHRNKPNPVKTFLPIAKKLIRTTWGRTRVGFALALFAWNAIAATPAPAATNEYISGPPAAGYFPLVDLQTTADIYVADTDWKVARIAAGDLAQDVERVTGVRPAVKHTLADLSADAVLVGTIGGSNVVDQLIASGRLDVSDIQGQWESFVIAPVADPLPGVKQALVIAGSDRRGTAYGVFELSRRIGVSPWYWWDDVTPAHREAIHVSPERVKVGPPAVKYRGIFINDEMWSIRPWAEKTFAPDEVPGLGPKTYAKVFELLLRLRANYLWPAMQSHTQPFNFYPQNKVVADDYAIVMGSSHIEPMLRNNLTGAEWDSKVNGEWNYQSNGAAIRDYWAQRLETNGKFENVYTLGIRGRDDEPMQGGATTPEKIALMEKIFADQRDLLARYVNPDLCRVPQVFIPYTEVLGLYRAGLNVPADAIICWPDDNFGYIRHLPNAAEQARPGGSGIYYHLEWLNGATTAYPWLNSTPPALIWEEMHKAWQYDARKLWVLNVGGLKPREVGMEFFFNLAWNPERWRHDNIRDFLEQWAARDLDAGFASEIAAIMEEYFRLGYTRRPEHLVQYRAGKFSYSWFSHDNYNDEAQQRFDRYQDISRRAQAVYDRLPRERKDPFFELVLYPVQCAALINEKVICADLSGRAGALGRASAADYARQARSAAARIVELTRHYDTGLLMVSNKWNHMMSAAPGPWGNQFHQFDMPPLSDFAGSGPPALDVSAEGGRADAVASLSVFPQDRRFIDLFNKGQGEIDWKAATSEPWVKLDQTGGRFAAKQRLWVSIDWSRAPKGRDVQAAVEITSNGGDRHLVVPVFNPELPAGTALTGFVESDGYVSMEAEHFTRKQDRRGAAWTVVNGLGRSGDSVTVLPPTTAGHVEPAAIAANSPSLEYDFYSFHAGAARLDLDCLPTYPLSSAPDMRVAVSLDAGAPEIVTGKGGDVLANLRRITTGLTIPAPGVHKLFVWMVDPGIVLDKLVLAFQPPPESYLGPPESFCANRPTAN